MPQHPIVIIGSGLGGCAAAATLSARGHRVLVLERNAWAGGKAAIHADRGYRFDMGPTILTVPSVLQRIVGEHGHALEDVLPMTRLDPQWRCFFPSGLRIDLEESEERMAEQFDRLQPGLGDGYRRLQAHARQLDGISRRFYFYKPVGGVRDTLDLGQTFGPKVLKDLWAMRFHSTFGAQVRKYVPHAEAAQVLDHYTQYVGSNPFAAPAVLLSIAAMQAGEGIWYPAGGTGAVPRALRRLAEAKGAEFRHGARVARIIVERGRATGVELESGERIAAAAVVSNMDTVRTHRELIGGAIGKRFLKRRTYEPACSGVVLYLGLNRQYRHLLHHNFVFSRDAHEEFDAIYQRGEPAPDPTCYLAAPALTEPDVAPPGGEALYILAHTPYLRDHHDWKAMLPAYRDRILAKLEKEAGMDGLRQAIVTERALTPQDIHDRYLPLHGAIYGLASHGRLRGGFKPSNRSPDVQGLYLAGGSAHPGPGMPMAMMSGWIAADACHRDAGGAAAGTADAATPTQEPAPLSAAQTAS